MSKGFYDRRKKRTMIYFVIFAMIGCLVFGFTAFFKHQQEVSADYGKVKDVPVDQKDTLETPEEKTETPIKVLVVNCGDALSVLVDCGATEVLYDTGGYETADSVVKKIKPYVDGDIDYLIISHSHADHCGGVPAVLKAYSVKTIITSGEKSGDSKEFDAAQKAIKTSSADVIEDKDMTLELGKGFNMDIIETFDPGETDNPNNLSVVAYLKRGEQSILLEGDSEKDAEKYLLGKFDDGVTVFVAGHHMSNTSNSAALLLDWSPSIIVASCAGPKDSEYGFPNKRALGRCIATTGDVYATYKSGDILITLEETGYTCSAPDSEKLSFIGADSSSNNAEDGGHENE